MIPSTTQQPTLGVASSDSALLYTILSPVGPYFKPGAKGLKLYAEPKYTRAWPGGVGDRKVGSNYGPTIHVQQEALRHGCHQVLWLYGDDHQLTEVGVMNIFMLYMKENGGTRAGLFTPKIPFLSRVPNQYNNFISLSLSLSLPQNGNGALVPLSLHLNDVDIFPVYVCVCMRVIFVVVFCCFIPSNVRLRFHHAPLSRPGIPLATGSESARTNRCS